MNDRSPIRQKISRGVNAYERESFDAALEIFDEVIAEVPSFADVHNKRGLCLAMLGRSREALEAFEDAVAIASSYAEAHLNRGIVLQELGEHDRAQAAFDEASRLDHRDGHAFPSHVGNQIAVEHAKLGDLYLVADYPEQAIDQYRAALRVRPRYLDVRTKLAEALIEVGELGSAQEELEFVLERNADFAAARLKYGIVMQRQGRRDEAINAWLQCMKDDPDDMRPRAYLASVGMRMSANDTKSS